MADEPSCNTRSEAHALADVRDRAERALAEITALSRTAAEVGRMDRFAELAHKAAGVRLVISFIDERVTSSSHVAGDSPAERPDH